jgi:hypothetical protein
MVNCLHRLPSSFDKEDAAHSRRILVQLAEKGLNSRKNIEK